MLCRSDNRFETVLHNLARYEFFMHSCINHYIVFNKKHTNPGGCKTRKDGADFPENSTPKKITKELLSMINIDESENQEIVTIFLRNLEEFSHQHSFRKLTIPQKLRSINITNRYFVKNDRNNEQVKEWTQEETDLIIQFLEQTIPKVYINI